MTSGEEEIIRIYEDGIPASLLGSSNPRTSSPDVALEEILEFEAATQRNHTPEPWNKVFEFQAPEPQQVDEAEADIQISPDFEQLNEIVEFGVPEPEQLDGGFDSRGAAHRNPDQDQLYDSLANRGSFKKFLSEVTKE